LRAYTNAHVALPHIRGAPTAFEHHHSADLAYSVSTRSLSAAHRTMGDTANSNNAIVSNLSPLGTTERSAQTKPFRVEHVT